MIFCGFNFCLFVQMQNIFTFWCIFQPLGWLFKILKFQIFQVLLKLVLDLLRLILVLYSIFVCNICLPKAYLHVFKDDLISTFPVVFGYLKFHQLLLFGFINLCQFSSVLVILNSTNYCCLALSIFTLLLLFGYLDLLQLQWLAFSLFTIWAPPTSSVWLSCSTILP